MFQTTLKQFDALYKRSAFLDNYKKEAMFADGMEEFEESREVVQRLVDEYVDFGLFGLLRPLARTLSQNTDGWTFFRAPARRHTARSDIIFRIAPT